MNIQKIPDKGSELNLNTQTALLNAIINSQKDIIIFSLDKDYCYTSFNEKHRAEMKQIWNTDIEIGMNLLDCMNIPELKKLAKQSIDRVLKGEGFTEVQHQPDHDIYYEFFWSPVILENEVIGASVIVHDITERKQNEKLIKDSEFQYRLLFNNMIEAFALHEIICDDNGNPLDYRFIDVNPAFEKLTGLKAELIIGKRVLEVLPKTEKYWIDLYGQVALTGKSVKFENYAKELNRHYQVTAFSQQKGQFVAVFEDITERKKTEEALLINEAFLRGILDATPFPVALVDFEDNNIDYWSQSALKLFGHTAPTAQEWYEIAYPDPVYRQNVVVRWKAFLEKAKLTGKMLNTGEYNVSCSDGSVRVCELYAGFIEDYLIVTFNDITEQKKADEKIMLQLNELKRWQEITMGREDRNRELKQEVNELLSSLGEKSRYPSQAGDSTNETINKD